MTKATNMIKTVCAIAVGASVSLASTTVEARDQIRIVGSSTVYPFITAAAEEFGRAGKFKTPIVESTGTGGGFKLFCQGVDENTPDFSNASRAIKSGETALCAKNGVTDITEVKVGYDGIVIANTNTSVLFELTRAQLFQALGQKIPVDGKLVKNPNNKWSDIDSKFPDVDISVYGPPPTSGTRDAFVELVLENACKNLPEFTAAFKDKKIRKKECHLVREDGKYIEAGENDNLIVKKLQSNPDSLGIFGYSFLDQNIGFVQGSKIEGVEPTFENIASGDYVVSRPLFIYGKNAHIGKIKGMKEFIQEIVSDEAFGEDGYFAERGLIPMPEAEREQVRAAVNAAIK
jgi:phosphate transport system substrate-binding protein